MIDYTEGSNKQYHTQLEENGVGDYVILTGDPKRVKDIASYFYSINNGCQLLKMSLYAFI